LVVAWGKYQLIFLLPVESPLNTDNVDDEEVLSYGKTGMSSFMVD